jgi:hypothetical protein
MISLLLGSGFSYDEQIPGMAAINKEVLSWTSDDIYIGGDQRVAKASDLQGLNEWNRGFYAERQFPGEFLQFYIREVIKDPALFNYEEFIDYFMIPYYKNAYPEPMTRFCESFLATYSTEHHPLDIGNLLLKFENIFSQLVANKLSFERYHEEASFGGHARYGQFIHFLSGVLDSNHVVSVHTLNHDLFFEYLGKNEESLSEHFCDGFTEENSPYYGVLRTTIGKLNRHFYVRVPYFLNQFKKRLRFYKLHGSVDMYPFSIANHYPDPTRIKMPYGVYDVVKEVQDGKGGFGYIGAMHKQFPDVLAGTSFKMQFYQDDYYQTIHDHFRDNLVNSDFLIVTGYGFKDKGINEIIEAHFLSAGKQMLVIDPYPDNLSIPAAGPVEIIPSTINAVDFKRIRKEFLNI